jgi:hypothetical protein
MFPIRSTTSHLLLALALAGFVVPAAEARACDSGMDSAAAPKCCAKKRSTSCGCCVPAPALSTQNLALTTPVQAGSSSSLSLPETTGCECRPTDSAPASSKSESRSTSERQSKSLQDEPDPVCTHLTVAPVARDGGIPIPPRIPLYLRTARLLI